MDLLVTTGWLEAALGQAGLVVLDASYHPLDPARDAAAEFAAGHVPGARFLDLATLCDAAAGLPSMRPSADRFAERLAAVGVGEESRVVLYDDTAHRTAARAAWLFHSFGVTAVALLDGGLQAWRAEGRPLAHGPAAPVAPVSPPPIAERPTLLRDFAGVRADLAAGGTTLVDARSPARFSGVETDPRPEVAAGHIPGSYNLPYGALFHPDGRWKRGPGLRAAFEDAGVDLDRPMVTTCGSGITAAVLWFGALLLGKRDVALYDGSWSEWGTRANAPRALGA